MPNNHHIQECDGCGDELVEKNFCPRCGNRWPTK
jgi:rRNA maturation endonuclease Nob1